MKKLSFSLGCLTLLGLAGCEHSFDMDSGPRGSSSSNVALQDEKVYPYDPEPVDLVPAIDQHMDRLARNLALVMASSPDVRDLVYAEVDKRVDGDYDAIYSEFEKLTVNGNTVSNMIGRQNFESTYKAPDLSSPENQTYLRRLVVSVPLRDETSAALTGSPLVAFVPSTFNEATDTSVKAYDQNGNITYLSTRTDPTQPVVVISIGERIDGQGAVDAEFRPGTEPVAERVVGAGEYLQGIRCDDLNAIEPWVRGAPELRLYVGSARLTAASNQTFNVEPVKIKDKILFKPPHRRTVFGSTWFVNHHLFTWTNMYSDYYTMQWTEEDGGPTVMFEMTVSGKFGNVQYNGPTLKIDFSKWEDDDDIGAVEIYRNDPTGNIPFGNIFTAKVESR